MILWCCYDVRHQIFLLVLEQYYIPYQAVYPILETAHYAALYSASTRRRRSI